MRSFLNGILASIGAESLTDEEFATVTALVAAYNQATYDDLSAILSSREAVSDFHERLKYHYIENGFYVDVQGVAKSNIFVGANVSRPSTFVPEVPVGKLTKNRVMITSESGFPKASGITSTELDSLDGVDSNVQDQIDDLDEAQDDIDERVEALESTPPGTAAWGDITGDVEDQADLVAYIAANAPASAWGSITGTIGDQTDVAPYIAERIFAYAYPIRLIQANTALAPSSDWILQADAGGGNITIDMLDPILLPTYHPWLVTRTDYNYANTVTLTCDNSNSGLFNTLLAGTTLTLAPGESVLLSCAQGGGWDVLQLTTAFPKIIEQASYSVPANISTAISVPSILRCRLFVVGASGPFVDPTIDDGITGQELILFGTDDTDTVELNSTTNIQLNGPIVLRDGSSLCLHWIDGLDKWVEQYRNEI